MTLMEACKVGDVTAVRACLQNGESLTTKESDGSSIIEMLAPHHHTQNQQGRNDILQLLGLKTYEEEILKLSRIFFDYKRGPRFVKNSPSSPEALAQIEELKEQMQDVTHGDWADRAQALGFNKMLQDRIDDIRRNGYGESLYTPSLPQSYVERVDRLIKVAQCHLFAQGFQKHPVEKIEKPPFEEPHATHMRKWYAQYEENFGIQNLYNEFHGSGHAYRADAAIILNLKDGHLIEGATVDIPIYMHDKIRNFVNFINKKVDEGATLHQQTQEQTQVREVTEASINALPSIEATQRLNTEAVNNNQLQAGLNASVAQLPAPHINSLPQRPGNSNTFTKSWGN